MPTTRLRSALLILLMLGLGLPLVRVATGQALRDGQRAPDIAGSRWINSESLTMAGLRGHVVLVEFWTYG